MNVLIPEDKLIVNDALLARLLGKNPRVRWSEMDWYVKEAYARYAALLDEDLRSYFGVADLSEVIAFYNAYYWSLVFLKRYDARYGFDAGIEQQAFKLLECAPVDVDWGIVEDLTRCADRT
jgi:hypothetical protein